MSKPAGYLYNQQGVKSCAVNTSAAVGSTFSVTFVIFDDSIPSFSVSVMRTVSVISPCDADQYLCSDGTCSAVDCDIR